MNPLQFHVDVDKCTQCDSCVKDCPSEIIIRRGTVPEAIDPPGGGCLACQHCLAVCPSGAISVFGLNPQDSLPLLSDSLPSYEQMKTFVRGRRSVRQFQDEDVSPALINELLADLAHAPTGCNDRDLTFSFVPGRKAMAILREKVMTAIEAKLRLGAAPTEFLAQAAAAYRNDGKDMLFRGAPHLLVVSPGSRARCGQEDAVLALAYFELLAQSANLGTTWCGVMKSVADVAPEVRAWLGLAPNAYFYAMMFGKPAVSYARTVQRDSAARTQRLNIV
jgi:ferredoxin